MYLRVTVFFELVLGFPWLELAPDPCRFHAMVSYLNTLVSVHYRYIMYGYKVCSKGGNSGACGWDQF